LVRVRLKLASPALRAGIKALLSDDPAIVVVESHDEGLTDSGGLEVVISTAAAADESEIGGAHTAPDFAMLLLLQERIDVRPLLHSSRAWGALPLDVSAEELRAAVHALSAGLIVASSPLLSVDGDTPRPQGPLSEREIEVLGLIAKGLANKQIAAELAISEHTVKFHVSSIYAKLNAANRTQAVREGLRNGWIVL
jgi:two-component system, NarL family, nitrate/nitrite response regulator NarL